MTLWQRLMVVGVLYAISALLLGVASAFFKLETLNYLVFHSVVFNVIVFAFFLAIAPFFVRILGLKLGGSQDENA